MPPMPLVLTTVLLVAQSCAQAPPPVRRDVVIGLVGEPASVFADDLNARLLAAAVTEQLVRRDAHDEYVARLALRVPTFENGGALMVTNDPLAPDGRIVATFELRPDLIWQDGAPLTAADVRFAWETDRVAPLGTEARWQADRVERVDVIDDRTARFTYRANERWDAYPLVAHVLPLHRLANATAAQRAQYEREPVHAGPFAVAAWLPGIGVTLSAFKRYALGAPALGRLEIRFYPHRSALLDALRRGEIDVVPAPGLEADLARTLDRFADGTRLQTYYTPSESLAVLRFGTRGERFADVRVRKAVELAVDRQSIVKDIFAGRALVPRGYLVAPHWAASDGAPMPKVDRSGARMLLAAAGFTGGGFGIQERAGLRMTPTILVAEGSVARTDVARRVAGDLAAVGIAADVRERPLVELEVLLARGDFDLAVVPESASDAQRASERYLGLAGPWFDVLASGAASAPRPAEKKVLYAELQLIWGDALPGLPLYQELRVDVVPLALFGVRPTPQGTPLTWNVAEWSFAGR